MRNKVLINPGRKRRIPLHFSWVDHRLVRNRYLEKCSCDALALYLFLLTVGDSEGLSYYRDESILKHLKLSKSSTVPLCRRELIKAGLISCLDGMYQVLDLDDSEEINSLKFSTAVRDNSIGVNKSCTSSDKDKVENSYAVSVGSVIDKMFGGE